MRLVVLKSTTALDGFRHFGRVVGLQTRKVMLPSYLRRDDACEEIHITTAFVHGYLNVNCIFFLLFEEEIALHAKSQEYFDKDTPQFSRVIAEKTLCLGLSTVRFRDAEGSRYEHTLIRLSIRNT